MSTIPAPRTRLPQLVVCALLTMLALVQAPGKIAPDTKLDLTEDPWGFMTRASDLWDPVGFAGQLQNQAYGYFFPIGPFFGVGDTIGLPAWLTQRLWWAVVLCVGFTGMYALARRLAIGTPAGWLIAGAAYALSPRILSTLGPVSAEAWPMALAPWVVVPLAAAVRRGSHRRAAWLSGLVVFAMGGVNAALVLAAIAPAGLFLLTRPREQRSLRLIGWWLAAVAAATAWWVGPLLILGAYSPPFLDYIESASVTTAPTSLAEVVRGTSHWVGYLGPGLGSPWQAGHDLVTEPALILDTVVVAAVGLAGLTLRRLPERPWLVTSLIVGVLAVTFGHDGPGTGWFSGLERDALDGMLAPLRNVHKFDPLIRIPLVLGLAHLIGVVIQRARDDATRTMAWAVTAMTALAVVGGAGPALAGRLPSEGSYEAVPDYWRQTAQWLDDYADGRALLVPGSRFGVYYWGTTNDEPLQALTDASWEVRNAIPLVPAGHIRMLDAVEQRLAAGQPSDGLAAYLARAGIGYLVVRNDLDQAALGTPRPVLVHQVLERSPGLARVAAFGPRVEIGTEPGVVVDDGLQPDYPAVEIWAVDDPHGSVSVTSLGDVTKVVGGPESLLDLADAGALPAGPTVLASDASTWGDSLTAVLTDGLRRREMGFGASLDNGSQTLTGSDPLRLDQPASDYRITEDEGYETVAEWLGVRDVRVSSSEADAGAWGGSRPERQPAAAFDGRSDSAWLADPATTGDPGWLRVDFARPTRVDIVQLELPRGLSSVAAVAVETDDGTTRVEPGNRRWVTVDLDGRPTDSLTVELRPESGSTEVMGIAELEIPGVTPRRVIRTPDVLDAGQPPAAIVMTAPTGHRSGCVETTSIVCAPSLVRGGEEDAGLERDITVPSTDVYRLTARLAPRPGVGLDRWLGRLAGLGVDVTASSSGVPDPLGGPLAAVDGDVATAWVAGPFDADPSLELRWPRPRRIDSLRLAHDSELAASAPTRVEVETDARSYDVTVGAHGALVDLPRLRTRHLSLRLHDPIRTLSYDPVTRRTTALPIGVSDVKVNGAAPGAELGVDRAIHLPCGHGPNLLIDGKLHRTEVDTSLRDLVELRPVEARVCESVDSGRDSTPKVMMTGRTNDVSLPSTSRWLALSLSMTDSRWAPGRPADTVASAIEDWGRSERRIGIGPRDEPALLAVSENANAGWVATLDGEQLEPVTVDGWQQGYVVPPGPAGTIHLRFGPTTDYRAALAIGLGLVVMLAAAAVFDRRVTATVAPAGRDGAALPPGGIPVRRTRRALTLVGGLVAFGCLGGAAGIAVALTVAFARSRWQRWRRHRPAARESAWAVATFAAYGAAGVSVAWAPAGSADYQGDGWAVQILSLVALAMVAAPTLYQSAGWGSPTTRSLTQTESVPDADSRTHETAPETAT